MNPIHISLFKCIECDGSLAILGQEPQVMFEDDPTSIREGIIQCHSCGMKYPVIEGTPLFFRKAILGHMLSTSDKKVCARLGFLDGDLAHHPLSETDEKILRVTDNWSYQWNEMYSLENPNYKNDSYLKEATFFNFIPIERETIRNKTVIVWCGGNGKEAGHLAKYTPRLLIVVDIGDEVYRVRHMLKARSTLLTVRCDIAFHPFKEGFADFSICDHALQHISDHRQAYRKLHDALAPGGIAAICVYSYENNILMTHGVEPMKGLLHLFSLKGQRYIALLPAFAVWLLIRLFYIPAAKYLPQKASKRIFLFDHMMFWAPSSFRFIWTACFDLIHAPISHHFRKEELLAMAAENDLQVKKIVNTHGTTWSMVTKKPELPSAQTRCLK